MQGGKREHPVRKCYMCNKEGRGEEVRREGRVTPHACSERWREGGRASFLDRLKNEGGEGRINAGDASCSTSERLQV
jgi:hypothetical protein